MQLAQMSNLRFFVFDQIYHEASTPENFVAVCRFSKVLCRRLTCTEGNCFAGIYVVIQSAMQK